jgi:hypothetical protein
MWLAVFAVVSLAGSLGAALRVAPAARAITAGNGGDFIVRCYFNTHAVAMDPIEAPGTFPTDHLHVFFGNMFSGTSGFPSVTSGDDAGSSGATMENDGLSPQTNCEDKEDTAAYWMPEPYFAHVAWLGPNGTGCSSSCNTTDDLYQRNYYTRNSKGTGTFQEIPDGSIMIAGYPTGCQPYTPPGGTKIYPDGCPTDGSRSYPIDTNIVRYTCGANGGSSVSTPVSAWPYNCGSYRDPDDSFDDGIVATVIFPECWNGKSDWTAPNDANQKVPGYVAPWIPDNNAPSSNGVRLNDFAYVQTNGTCPSGFGTPVVQLAEHLHLLKLGNAGSGFGEPSSCISEPGYNWNNQTRNAEWTDGDGHTPHTCAAASVPSSGITLSFSCTQGGDPNCTFDTGQTGCASSNGDCYIGANPYGWETLHADYWQTWQEGGGTVTGMGTDNFPDPTQGAFRDLIEDCSTEGSGPCSFITNTKPAGRVYGDPENT